MKCGAVWYASALPDDAGAGAPGDEGGPGGAAHESTAEAQAPGVLPPIESSPSGVASPAPVPSQVSEQVGGTSVWVRPESGEHVALPADWEERSRAAQKRWKKARLSGRGS